MPLKRFVFNLLTGRPGDLVGRARLVRAGAYPARRRGTRLEVLAGARELLDAGAIDVIQFEYNQRRIHGGRFLRDVFLLLADTDYAIGKVTPRGIQWCGAYDCRLESFVQGNWLACVPRRVGNFPRAPGWLSGPSRRRRPA